MPISTFTGLIANQSTTLVNARELHERLQISTPFHKWIQRRIEDYNFVENLDFIGTDKFVHTEAGFFGVRETLVKDYHITVDMAKELCMLERSELGRQARRYFINMEKQSKQLALQLQEQVKRTYLAENPEAKQLIRYRNAGLTVAEVAKLMNLSESQVTTRFAKMFKLGFFERKNGNQHITRQLALFA
jgi:phage anti-repressor protein